MLSDETNAKLVKARKDGEFTNYFFICEGQQIPVHKIIVCTQSPVFRSACMGPFTEASGTYSLEEYPLSIVHRLIDYMYTGDYEIETLLDISLVPAEHAAMFAMGDKYLIDGLKVKSAKHYSNALGQSCDVTSFLCSIYNFYTLTPDTSKELRNRAVWFARAKLFGSLASSEVKDRLNEVFDEVPGFFKDLVWSFLDMSHAGSCSTVGCGRMVAVEVLQSRCKKCGKGGAIAWDS